MMNSHQLATTQAPRHVSAHRSPVRPASRGRTALTFFGVAATAALALVTVVNPASGAIANPYYSSPYAPVSQDLLTSAAQELTVDATSASTDFTREGYSFEDAPDPAVLAEESRAAAYAAARAAKFTESQAKAAGVAASKSRLAGASAEDALAAGAAAAKAAKTADEAETTSTSGSSSSSGSSSAPNAAAPNAGSAQAIAYDMLQSRGYGQDQYSCLVALWNKESGWRYNAANSSSGAYGIPQALPGSKMSSAGSDWRTNPATQITWGLSYISGRYGSPCGAWSHSKSVGWY